MTVSIFRRRSKVGEVAGGRVGDVARHDRCILVFHVWLKPVGNVGAAAGDIMGVKRALARDDPPVERKVFHRAQAGLALADRAGRSNGVT